ncbi:unnamed protein product [Ceratitis capitata]|uniref:(Mediterranean fruit fly) hypothetical protein n=1 Tax=Ceratitis capitata TaxID=7213 RepID=A0A811UFF0_CERCA|nr:unnamed protein product [Ceratitis capitata]
MYRINGTQQFSMTTTCGQSTRSFVNNFPRRRIFISNNNLDYTKCEEVQENKQQIFKSSFPSQCDLAVVKFTYIRCKSLDPNLVRLSFMKKSTDYSLYFGERTYDACKFLANRKLYRIADYLFGIIEEYSNMNHSCPYQVTL